GSPGMNSMGGNTGTSPASRPSQAGNSMGSASMNPSPGATSGLSEVYQVQIELAGLKDNIAALKNEEQVAAARFNNLLNRPLGTSVDTLQVLAEEPLDIAWLSVNDSMFSRNPMLGMLHYEQQSLAARSRMQKKMGLPMVGVGLNYSVISKSGMSASPMNGEDMIMPMVSVTLPVYRQKYKAMQAETNLMKKASEYSYQATVNALQTEYFEALQSYNDAQRRMKLYATQSQLTRKSLDISIKGFSSAGSLSDILRIRQQLLDYELKQVEALVQFNQAKAWIMRIRETP
ncbi:MAG TPA: TolC family protein, partial [Paludibacter sp.]|nr:TolC family protein [Paludibacter sp.]